MRQPWKLETISSHLAWHSLTVDAPVAAEEQLWELLTALGAEGVSGFSDDSTGVGRVLITGYFAAELDIAELASQLSERIAQSGIAADEFTITYHSTSANQWAENWKRHYAVTRVTRFLTIVPAWDSAYQTSAGELVIRLDPELAFGTGTHPTTVLALIALEQVIRGGEQMIDVGTGSGVLAIAAMLLGARGVLATDIDDDAVNVAKSNIALNPNAAQIRVFANNMLRGITQVAEIIIANILAEVLIELVDDAARLLPTDGHLILSGIYCDKVDTVTSRIAAAGLKVKTHLIQGEWHCLIATQVDPD